MRAQVLTAFNRPYVFRDDYPEPPSPTGNDILVRVLAAGYCHTDAVYAAGTLAPATLPRIGCHEFAGVVYALGPDVPDDLRAKLPIGTKIGVPVRGYHCCGKCQECQDNGDELYAGYSIYCPLGERLGLSADGGFQDYALADARQVELIPDPLTMVETAPLMCAGLTIYAALRKAEAESGSKPLSGRRIAISGAGGGLGHLGVQFAIKMGWGNVVAVDAADGPLRVVKEAVKNLTKEEMERVTIVDARKDKADDIRDLLCGKPKPAFAGERGLDTAIILPESQQALDYAMKLLRNHGACILVSFPESGFHFDAKDIVYRDIRVVGNLVGKNRHLREMLALAASHGVRALVKTYPLEELNTLVEDYHKGMGGKLVVDMEMKA